MFSTEPVTEIETETAICKFVRVARFNAAALIRNYRTRRLRWHWLLVTAGHQREVKSKIDPLISFVGLRFRPTTRQ
jgi:hypothetical protein